MSTNCSCSSPASFPTRSARSGVVLHEHKAGAVVVLVAAKAPRQWLAMVGNAEGWWKGTFTIASANAYHASTGGVTYELAQPDRSAFETMLADPAHAASAFAAAEREYALSQVVRASSAPPPVPHTPSSSIPIPATPIMTAEEKAAKEKRDREIAEALAALNEPGKSTTGYTPRAKQASVTSDEFKPVPPNAGRYWYESEQDTRLLTDYVSLRRAGYDTNMMIVGASGFGKTECVIRLGERMSAVEKADIPVHVVNCQAITTPEKWIGQMEVDPAKGTYFQVSQHLRWVERDTPECKAAPFCIILYDEITRLRPELGNMTFSLLDGQQGLEVPQMMRKVHMSPENIVFATANIGSAYSGTFMLDWALRGRFDMTLERKPDLPEEEEVKVLTTATGVDEASAEAVVRVAVHTRELWKNGELESPISPRLELAWCRLIAGGYTIKDAAEYTVLPVYAEDGGVESNRAIVRLAIGGKVA